MKKKIENCGKKQLKILWKNNNKWFADRNNNIIYNFYVEIEIIKTH